MPALTGTGARRLALLLAVAALALAPAVASSAPRPLPRRVQLTFGPALGMFGRGATDSGFVELAALAARGRAAHDDTLVAAVQFELGARLAWFGQMSRAIPVLEEARDRSWSLRDTTLWVQACQWLAYSFNEVGRLHEGGKLARRALPAAVALGYARCEAYLRTSSSFEALSAGRVAEAREGYRHALPMFDLQKDHFGACEALLGLGRCYTVTGPRDSARSIFTRAAARAEFARLPRSAAAAYNNLATQVYLDGDPEAALEAWRLAARTTRATGDLSGTIAAAGNVCLALSNLDRSEEARAIADSLLEYVTRSGSREGMAQVTERIALLELTRGRPASAAREYRKAMALAGGDNVERRAECIGGLVRSLVSQDSAAQALALYEEQAPPLEALVSDSRRMELAQAGALAAFSAGSLARSEELARRVLALAQAAKSARDELDAERLLARIAARQGNRTAARAHLDRADDAWRRGRAQVTGLEWRTMLSHPAVLAYAWGEIYLGEVVETRRSRIAPAFEALERIRSTLLLELASGPGSRTVAMPPVTLDRMQRSVLAPGELLLLAWTADQRSWLLAVSRDTAVSLPLPPDDKLDRDVNLLRESIAAKPALGADAIDRMLADAGERLLGPVVPLLRRYSRVIVVPAGPLQRLPFEALRLPLGRGGAAAPLGVTHVVARAPSASLLALARSRTKAPNGELALLAVANPHGPGGRALPGAVAEVRALEARYRDVRALEAPRDAGIALAAMSGAAAVHVAAHADFDPVSPWRSALQLADGPPVRARDLLAQKFGPELVVLAACETAGGTMRGTGGMEGLSAAVLCAGSRGVVATLWPVDDALARHFVSVFYEEAERAPDAGTALSRARASVRADGAPVSDWAAFTLVGDPAARIRLVRK